VIGGSAIRDLEAKTPRKDLEFNQMQLNEKAMYVLTYALSKGRYKRFAG